MSKDDVRRAARRRAGLLPALLAAFIAGIVLADRGLLGSGAALVLGVHAAAAGAWLPEPRARAAAALALALAAGCLGLAQRVEGARREAPGAPREVTVEARLAWLRRGAAGVAAELRDVVCVEPGCGPVPRALRLHVEPAAAPHAAFEDHLPGARLRARLRLRAVPARRNPGGRDRARELARHGVAAEASLVHPALHVEVAPPGALRAGLETARRRGAARLARHGRGGALLAALAFGAPAALGAADREALARLGLSHLLAVSGLHVGLVAGLAFGLARVGLRRLPRAPGADLHRVALAAALGAAFAYAAATGFGVPVRRALVLLVALAGSVVRGRVVLRGHPLCTAALVVLALEPQALFAPGAQLSFAATAALVLARRGPQAPPAHGAAARLARGLAAGLRTSATAALATAPLVAWQLGRAAPLGWLTNLVAVPLTAALLLPAALASALLGALAPGLAAPVSAAASAVAEAALTAAGWAAARTPGAGTSLSPGSPALAAAALLAAAGLSARGTALRAGAAVASAALLAVAPPAAWEPPVPRAVFLDVGAGDAVLVQGRRAAVLVDGGRAVPGGFDLGEAVVVPALRALGVRRLDLVIASHADLDHRGGLPAVLAALPTALVWLPPGGLAEPGFAALRAAARQTGAALAERGAGDPALELGDLHLETLWPPRHAPGLGRNDRSLVVRVTPREDGAPRLLLAGDLEAAGEAALLAQGTELRAEVLKLGHHGSATSSGVAFLGAVQARLAVASAPRHARHPLPDPAVLARAAAAGARVAWTGRDGAVLVGLTPGAPVRGVAATPP